MSNRSQAGWNLSPMLFSIFLNDLHHYLCTNGTQGVLCDTEDENIYIFLRIFVLLFADDTILFSNIKEDLQRTLNTFESYCTAWKLSVNTSKTKVLIFAGGRLAKDQTFYFNGHKLDTISEYKYLGILLARSGAFAKAKSIVKRQATIRNRHNQIPHPALKTKREITKYIN